MADVKFPSLSDAERLLVVNALRLGLASCLRLSNRHGAPVTVTEQYRVEAEKHRALIAKLGG